MRVNKAIEKRFINFCYNHTGLKKESMRNGKLGFTRILEYLIPYEYIEKNCKTQKPQTIKILDIGSGYTIFPMWLLYNNFNVTILDLPEKEDKLKLYFNLPVVKKHINDFRIIIQDAKKIDLGEKFDFITVISSMEHMYKEMYIIKRLAGHLKNGGKMFVTFPIARKLYEFDDPYLIRCYDEKSIEKRLINPSGLKLLKMRYFKAYNKELVFPQLYKDAVKYCDKYMKEVDTTDLITDVWPLNTGILILQK
ncbi:methyltransferase domain-containing protein [Candidatus Dependentiae bacterium]|nr:methyltransferase domain-containing protein [Candidatus Dependentiae bacterium]